MDTVSKFLEFWEDGKPNNPDPIKKLAAAYRIQEGEIAELRKEVQGHLDVGKDARGRWVPIFGRGGSDEAAALAARLEASVAKLESISNDIEKACGLMGDVTTAHLNGDLHRERSGIVQAEASLRREERRALHRERGGPGDQAVRVGEARAHLARLKAERAGAIADLESRRDELAAITGRY